MRDDLKKKIEEACGALAKEAIREAQDYINQKTIVALKHLAHGIQSLVDGQSFDADSHFREAAYHIQKRLAMQEHLEQLEALLPPLPIKVHPVGMEIDL